jgi:hypothetical protein
MDLYRVPPARRALALIIFVSLAATPILAQSDSVSSSLPDDPGAVLIGQNSASLAPAATGSQSQPAPQPSQNDSLAGKQTKRILHIIPNFRSVSVDEKLPPESIKDKFMESTQDSFDYSSFIFVGMLAAVGQAENSYPEFHQGAAGYGRYYWHTLADQTDENYQVEFIFPVVLHQDPRFYTLGRGGFVKRAFYAFSRIAVTRTDHGNETFNASEIVGAGAAAGISDFYYPSPERTWTKTGQRWVLNVGLDGATYVFQEFWPNINNKFFHQKD